MPHAHVGAPSALALLIICAPTAPAQSLFPWDDPGREGTIALAIEKPAFQSEGFDFGTLLAYLTARWPVARSLTLVAELPVQHVGVDNLFGEPVSATVIGNPYVGIEARLVHGHLIGELGFRPPLASGANDALERIMVAITALLADYDRSEAFLNDTWSVRGRLGYRWRSAAGVTLGAAAGPTLLNVGEDLFLEEKTETALDYRVDLGYDAGRFSLGTVFSGRYFPGDPEALLPATEGPVHQLAFGVGATIGETRPTAVMRFPLDRNLSGATRFVLGVGVSITP